MRTHPKRHDRLDRRKVEARVHVGDVPPEGSALRMNGKVNIRLDASLTGQHRFSECTQQEWKKKLNRSHGYKILHDSRNN